MLIISRRKDQKLIVADEIEITILEVGRTRVKFGIKAPKHVHIASRLKGTEPAPIDVESPESADNAGSTIAGVTSFSSRS
jgi:hypothetical protein